ncbi:MAG: hypothetical protein DRN20_03000 [Thermoplasmata archaeon]|nr:MAG: hypothetical protein DRN20_03000 [Thermoplasmata archaeon]
MSEKYRVVYDPVHGSIKIAGVEAELVNTPLLQRLRYIKQLGMTYLVFPGANHTRFEHSLGTYWLSVRVSKELGIEERWASVLRVAALLHDIGHGPYSHTLENLVYRETGLDHMDITVRLIRKGEIKDIIEEHAISADEVASLIKGGRKIPTLFDFAREKKKNDNACAKNLPRFLHQIMHSSLDIDQLDYLLRDAHYTGVAHGIIDADRIINTLRIVDDTLFVDKKGINALEGMLVARSLMYSSVYFHKTGRIAQHMLYRAVEKLLEDGHVDVSALTKMCDHDVLCALNGAGGYCTEIMRRIIERRLFKAVYFKSISFMGDEERDAISRMVKEDVRRELEDHLCSAFSLPQGYAIIDIPVPEVLISEPRLSDVGVMILDNKKPQHLYCISAISRALSQKPPVDWALMVALPLEKSKVSEAKIERILFGGV